MNRLSSLLTAWRRAAFLSVESASRTPSVCIDRAPVVTPVAHRAVVSIRRVAGQRLTCVAGCVWITVDHDPRDIVLDAGESFEASNDERVLVYGLEDSRLLAAAGGAR
jgi:hypothetical protein